ncbi:MAG TPA: ATP-binding protein [Stellaceae bacterium]|nr:ATP-binding protein [Stellaceae bacterium]
MDQGKRAVPGNAASGAIRALRLLFLGMIVVPLVLGAVGAYLSHRTTYDNAVNGLAEAVAVAEENTNKVLETHMLVAARIEDLLGGLSDEQIRGNEQALHNRISAQIKDVPEVAAAWVIDADGHELVSARVYPVDRTLVNSSRADFQALKNPKIRAYIWAVRARSLDNGVYRPYFTVSRRLTGPDGSFRGIIVVAVSGNYVASFYDSLLGDTAYTASVLREDGTVLAHYPMTGVKTATAGGMLAKAMAAKRKSGIVATGMPLEAEGSIVAYRRLADYPIYVAIGRTRASILREWLYSIAGYAGIGIAAAIGLMALTLLALRRTRREQQALAQARDAVAERAAIEAQLYQAQKMEAVGLLTAGIAHDFNNLLTVVAGHIALLESDPECPAPRREKLIGLALGGCERAAALTKRLLSFARREPADPQPTDANEAVRGMSELPWRSMSDQIATEFRLQPNLWPVFVDAQQLENALLNIALNARDAMAGRGTLTIETANTTFDDAYAAAHPGVTPGLYIEIRVGDTGCGMPPEVRRRAFDPFFSTKEAGKGTGLGLSQVYGFVTRFGGYCAIDSTPGQGTTIKLYLPRYVGERESAEAGGGVAAASRDREAGPRLSAVGGR